MADSVNKLLAKSQKYWVAPICRICTPTSAYLVSKHNTDAGNTTRVVLLAGME